MSKKKFWEGIKLAFLFFTLIIGVIFLYGWWNREQKLKELESRLKQLEKEHLKSTEQYQLQQKQLDKVISFTKRPDINKFFTNLLQVYSRKFADKQKIKISNYPLNFGGFYQEKDGKTGSSSEVKIASLGNTSFNLQTKQTIISLNQLFLFNKLGHQKYFATLEFHLAIDFNSLMEVISHELAHYFQFVKHKKSSCKSDLETDRCIDWLAKEHEEFTQKIYQMMKNSTEYPVWESEWKKV